METTAQLSADKTSALLGEDITFTFSGNNSSIFTFGIYKDDERIDTVTVEGNTYTTSFTEPGNYSAYMTGYSYGDHADSNWINWEVSKTTAQLSADKTSALLGEDITFTFSGNNSNIFTFGIYKDDERIDTVTVEGNTYTRSFSEPGNYSAYMTGYSYEDHADSNWIQWTVEKTSAQLSADKTTALLGEDITFTFSGNNSSIFTFGIYKDDERIDTVTVEGNTYTRSFSEPGNYSAYMTGYSYDDHADSNWIKWTVLPSTINSTHTVTFAPNGGTGTMNPATATQGQPFLLPDCGFTPPAGQRFEVWKIGDIGYQPGNKVTITADTTVTALWEDIPPKVYTITYDANGGTGDMDSATATEGQPFTLPECGFTAPDGQQFAAWKIDNIGFWPGTEVIFIADTTVTAVWKTVKKPDADAAVVSASRTTTGLSVTVTPQSGLAYASGYVAAYDVNGQMLGTAALAPNARKQTLSLPYDSSRAETVKAFFLDENARPVTKDLVGTVQ